jgi:Mn2+/Fe2+ NRAMP family transporter
MVEPCKRSWLGIIGPGLLVAATGVGAGDLATAGFAGNLNRLWEMNFNTDLGIPLLKVKE